MRSGPDANVIKCQNDVFLVKVHHEQDSDGNKTTYIYLKAQGFHVDVQLWGGGRLFCWHSGADKS